MAVILYVVMVRGCQYSIIVTFIEIFISNLVWPSVQNISKNVWPLNMSLFLKRHLNTKPDHILTGSLADRLQMRRFRELSKRFRLIPSISYSLSQASDPSHIICMGLLSSTLFKQHLVFVTNQNKQQV